MKLIIIVLLGLTLVACSGDKFSKMSNQELANKKRHCDSIKNKAPGFAVSCENVRKEIDKRRKERLSKRNKK